MPPRPKLSKSAAAELRKSIQYLNLEEMRAFCKAHEIPLYIHLETSTGKLRRTSDRDRKDIVLERIFQLGVHGKRTGPTTYSSDVVGEGALPNELTARTRVKYGQYEKHNPKYVALLESLTDGEFRTGMIARLVLRDFWTAGKAPTFKQFAAAWLRATAEHTEPRPEGAYLVDLAKGDAGPGWKELRVRKAKAALDTLAKLTQRD